MTNSLVAELQTEALDRNVTLSDLLRKALVVAAKLNLDEIGTWIAHELNGYPPDQPVPEYRLLRGQVVGFNPFSGWLPIHLNDDAVMDRLRTRSLNQPIREIEIMANSEGPLAAVFSTDTCRMIWKALGEQMQIQCQIPRGVLGAVLDVVRTRVLTWAMELEKNGVTGEGLSFSAEERKRAQSVTVNMHVQNVENIGVVGEISGMVGKIDQRRAISADDLAALAKLLDQIGRHVGNLGLTESQQDEIRASINSACTEIEAGEPNQSRLRKALEAIGRITERVIGSVIASGINAELRRYM